MPRKPNIDPQARYERNIKIMEMYDADIPVTKIAEELGMSVPGISYILNSKTVAKLREERRDIVHNKLLAAYQKNANNLALMMDKYITLGLETNRIDKSSLPQLATYFAIFLDKFGKLEELKLKKEDLSVRRKEIEKLGNGEALLAGFAKVIADTQKAATHLDEGEKEEMEDEEAKEIEMLQEEEKMAEETDNVDL